MFATVIFTFYAGIRLFIEQNRRKQETQISDETSKVAGQASGGVSLNSPESLPTAQTPQQQYQIRISVELHESGGDAVDDAERPEVAQLEARLRQLNCTIIRRIEQTIGSENKK